MKQHFNIERSFASQDELVKILEYLSSENAHYDLSGTIRYLGYNEFLDRDVVAILEGYSRKCYSYIQDNYGYTLQDFNPNKVHVEIIEKGQALLNSYDLSRSGQIGIFMLINDSPESKAISFNGNSEYELFSGDMVFFTEGDGLVKNMDPTSNQLYVMTQWFELIV